MSPNITVTTEQKTNQNPATNGNAVQEPVPQALNQQLTKQLQELHSTSIDTSDSETSDERVENNAPLDPALRGVPLLQPNVPPPAISDSYPLELTHAPPHRERAFSDLDKRQRTSFEAIPMIPISAPISAARSRTTSISSDNAPPFKAGFLTLYGDTRYDARHLWFVLQHNQLAFYHADPSHRSNPLGEISLTDMQMIDIVRCHDRPKLLDIQVAYPIRKVR